MAYLKFIMLNWNRPKFVTRQLLLVCKFVLELFSGNFVTNILEML